MFQQLSTRAEKKCKEPPHAFPLLPPPSIIEERNTLPFYFFPVLKEAKEDRRVLVPFFTEKEKELATIRGSIVLVGGWTVLSVFFFFFFFFSTFFFSSYSLFQSPYAERWEVSPSPPLLPAVPLEPTFTSSFSLPDLWS